MIGIRTLGAFTKTNRFLSFIYGERMFMDLHRFGKDGVDALSKATPKDTGATADSWDYKITFKDGRYFIEWFNTNVNEGVNVAVILQYGHATGTGGYIQGIDYINPTMKPIFEELTNNVWKKVTDA